MPNRPLLITFDGGLVTARDRTQLRPGELVQAEGIHYKRGDNRAHKIPGRAFFQDPTGIATGPAKGLALCQFDSGGTDLLVAVGGTVMYKATPGLTGTFSSLDTGHSSSATRYSFAHAYNRWYIANGYDRVRVLESDGTVRYAGMEPPDVKPVITVSGVAVTSPRPASDSGSFTDLTKAIDVTTPLTSTYAYAKRTTAGSTTHNWFGWAAAATTSETLHVIWSLGNPNTNFTDFGTGATRNLGARITLLIEYTLDNTAGTPTYVTLADLTNVNAGPDGYVDSSVPIPDGTARGKMQVRATLTYISGSKGVVLRVYDIRMQTAQVTAFDTTTGLYYAFTEWDADRSLESPASLASDLVVMDDDNLATITNLPGTAAKVNSNATHYKIYRTVDGGAVPTGLGEIATIPIQAGTGSPATFSWADDFGLYNKNTLPERLYPLVSAQGDQGVSRVPRDSPPPEFSQINYYKGSLVGVSRAQPRALFYSFAGRVESWPSIYVFDSFPMPEHDTLVATVTVGETLLVAGAEIMLCIYELPRVAQSLFQNVEIKPLRGAPGCVGQDAIVAYSVGGEPRAAWVSKFGVYETDGTATRCISRTVDWYSIAGLGSATAQANSRVVLWYDPAEEILFLHYESGGVSGYNDKTYTIHMSREHADADGNPKWTGPHSQYASFRTGGYVSGIYRRYNLADIDSTVYVEWYGTSDAQDIYDPGTSRIPINVQTGRIYDPSYGEFGIYKGRLRHTAFGGSDTVGVSWVTGRDARTTTQSKASTLTVSAQKGTEFLVARLGEWHQVQISHAGTSGGAIIDILAEVLGGGGVGRVA